MRTGRGEEGQAAVELVALLPLLVVIALAVWQGLVAGQAWWMAGAAAREAARAAALGGDARAAALRVLPGGMRPGLQVKTDDKTGGVLVRVRVPRVVGGSGGLGSVSARARMEPQA
jgi:pilus assembly protein CpaE